MPNRTTLGKLIPKVHTRWRKILGSKWVRRVIPTYIKSIGRPTSKSPDKQNGLEGEINQKMSPHVNPIYRSPPKPPNMKNRKEKEKKIWDYRSPHKPPFIQNVDGEIIGFLEKENLCYAEPEYRLPPKLPRIQDNAEERIWPLPKLPNMKNIEGKDTDPLLILLI